MFCKQQKDENFSKYLLSNFLWTKFETPIKRDKYFLEFGIIIHKIYFGKSWLYHIQTCQLIKIIFKTSFKSYLMLFQAQVKFRWKVSVGLSLFVFFLLPTARKFPAFQVSRCELSLHLLFPEPHNLSSRYFCTKKLKCSVNFLSLKTWNK